MKRGVVFLLCLIFLSSFSFARELHDASDFYVNIGGADYNLEEAYIYDLLDGGSVYSASSSSTNFSHSVEEIWVSTVSGEMSFLDALNGDVPYSKLSSNSYFVVPGFFVSHYATDIIFLDGDSLQDKINSISLCSSDFDDSCGKTDCVNPGTIQCDGSCSGTSSKSKGTDCNSGNGECDGSGNCNACIFNSNSYSSLCYNNDRYAADTCGDPYKFLEDCHQWDGAVTWESDGYEMHGKWYNRKCYHYYRKYVRVSQGCVSGSCQYSSVRTSDRKRNKVSKLNCWF